MSKPVKLEGVNIVQAKSDSNSQQTDTLQKKHQQDSSLEPKSLNELFKTLESCVEKLSKSINRANRGGKKHSGKRSYIECYNCHKLGHIARDCSLRDTQVSTNTKTDRQINQENL